MKALSWLTQGCHIIRGRRKPSENCSTRLNGAGDHSVPAGEAGPARVFRFMLWRTGLRRLGPELAAKGESQHLLLSLSTFSRDPLFGDFPQVRERQFVALEALRCSDCGQVDLKSREFGGYRTTAGHFR